MFSARNAQRATPEGTTEHRRSNSTASGMESDSYNKLWFVGWRSSPHNLTLLRAAWRLAAACPARCSDGSEETDVVTTCCIGGSATV